MDNPLWPTPKSSEITFENIVGTRENAGIQNVCNPYKQKFQLFSKNNCTVSASNLDKCKLSSFCIITLLQTPHLHVVFPISYFSNFITSLLFTEDPFELTA